MSPQFIIYFSGAGIAGFVFNETIDEGVTGVLAAVENVNESLLEIETKVLITQSYLCKLNKVSLFSCMKFRPCSWSNQYYSFEIVPSHL